MKNKKNILWLLILIVVIVGVIFLVQHTFLDNNQTNDETQQTSQKSSQASTSKSTSQLNNSDETTSLSGDKELTLDSTMSGSSSDTSETGVDVQAARIKLYQAGIDSSGIDDATIAEYWQQAQEKQIDFAEYVKSQIQ